MRVAESMSLLALLDEPAAAGFSAEAPPPARTGSRARRARARELQMQKASRWIEAGKPVAVQVARSEGKVTAETFRIAAAALRKLPPTYDQQRALSWIPGMFAQLVKAGVLRKRIRADGSVVREYSKAQNNDQVVYELAVTAGMR